MFGAMLSRFFGQLASSNRHSRHLFLSAVVAGHVQSVGLPVDKRNTDAGLTLTMVSSLATELRLPPVGSTAANVAATGRGSLMPVLSTIR